MQRATAILISLSFYLFGLLDILIYKVAGNLSTISRVMLATANEYPLVPVCLVYSFGVLCRHCFFPIVSDDTPTTADMLGRMTLVLAPTFYVTVVVAANDDFSKANRQVVLFGGWWGFFGILVAAFIVGLWAGRWVPQHLSPADQETIASTN